MVYIAQASVSIASTTASPLLFLLKVNLKKRG